MVLISSTLGLRKGAGLVIGLMFKKHSDRTMMPLSRSHFNSSSTLGFRAAGVEYDFWGMGG